MYALLEFIFCVHIIVQIRDSSSRHSLFIFNIKLCKRYYGVICSRFNMLSRYKLKTSIRDLDLIEVARRSDHDQLHWM